jgi:O-antigen ligase
VHRNLVTAVVGIAALALIAGIWAHGFSAPIAADISRQVFALVYVVVLAQLFRDRSFLRRLIAWFLVFAGCTSVLLLYEQLSIAGVQSFLDAEALRYAKYQLQDERGVALNSYAYSIAVTALLGAGMTAWRWGYRLILAGSAFAILWLFASAAAAGAVVLAGIATAAIWIAAVRLRVRPWLVGVLGVGLWIGVHVTMALTVLDTEWLRDVLNELTTGRLYMWAVALQVFADHPLFGAGPQSWEQDLPMGASALLAGDAARYANTLGGAYHSIFFTTLAERGLVGLFAVLSLMVIILALCVKVFRKAAQLRGRAVAKHRGWVLSPTAVVAVVLTTLVRGLAEYSGPIAYANAHADFVALTIIGLLLGILKDNGQQLRAPRSEPGSLSPPSGLNSVHSG